MAALALTARRAALLVTVPCTFLGLGGAAMLVLHLDEAFLRIHELAFLPRHPPHPLTPDTRLGQGLGFGFFAGGSLTQSWLLAPREDRALGTVARALLAGHALWYVLDSASSAASGAWVNVASNTVYAFALGVPLAILARR